MVYLIGTDEAGYGPNFGPLVISASLWQAPDDAGNHDLFDRLKPVIANSLGDDHERDPARVVFADSKILYRPGGDLRHLERGLWAAWAMLGYRPRCWRDVWNILAAPIADGLDAGVWFDGYDAPLPDDSIALDWFGRAQHLQSALNDCGVQLLALRSRAVFPLEFNRLLKFHGSKGTLLSHLTLELVAQLMEPLETGPISVVCDKHGARNFYGRLLGEHFPDSMIEIHGESLLQSVYRFGPEHRRMEFCFRAKAESCLPAALASMASKYLRELAMRPFNNFWCSRVPGLAPTAGYPLDARRFKTAITAVQSQLGIEDDIIWRVK